MPFVAVCPDHPDVDVSLTDMLLVHAASDHPGERVQDLAARTQSRFVTQVECRGVSRVRTFACCRCAVPVSTLDMDRPPYCDHHLPTGVLRR